MLIGNCQFKRYEKKYILFCGDYLLVKTFIFLFIFSVTVSHWYHQPGLSGEINGAKPFIKKYKTHHQPTSRTEQVIRQ